ncbi:hypothetical protein GG804_18215 [Sphingomonas histidinilytica]|jgi:hypothetical protein|uniref:hypothetical protein n=1 Tax=Sphingomonadales TaxID=204457 RepID=UPI00076FEA49|nr:MULTISPECIES: hypothetical protein [Sphingomonadaceae]AMK22967.1 hypothetical protein K426_10110 [Sphingobium sp. TKS]MBO9378709.1 hypothetical protein [Rhizorhabdus histidinilytica]MCF8706703.1 hypothetical protein [Rhizorhapis sp. SPR117]
MAWIARLLLLIPALIAGWFVSREDPRFWVVTMVIALVFIALTCILGIYAPGLRMWPRRGER